MARPLTERLKPEDRRRLGVVGRARGDSAVIRCSGTEHSLSVTGGSLVLHDHDVADELTLLAFGARLPTCLAYHAAWEEAAADDRFFTRWASAETLGVQGRTRLRDEWNEYYWEGWPAEPAAASVLFGPGWQDELGVAVARRWAGAGNDQQHRLIARAVQVRARVSFVQSLRGVQAHRKPDALVPLHVVVGPRLASSVEGRLALAGSRVTLRLAMDWLWDVWGSGSALVAGDFVLARHDGVLLRVEWQPSGGRGREHRPAVVAGEA